MKSRLFLVVLLLMGISYSSLAANCGGIPGVYIGNLNAFGVPNSNYTLAFFPGGGGAVINEGTIGLPVVWHDFDATNGAFGHFVLAWKLNQNNQGGSSTYTVTINGQAAFVPVDGSPLLPTVHSERVVLKSTDTVVNSDCSISGTYTGSSYPADNLALDNPYPSTMGGSTTFTLPIDHARKIN